MSHTHGNLVDGRLFGTLKIDFAVDVRLMVCQLASVIGFSVERLNYSGCKSECKSGLLKFAHM